MVFYLKLQFPQKINLFNILERSNSAANKQIIINTFYYYLFYLPINFKENVCKSTNAYTKQRGTEHKSAKNNKKIMQRNVNGNSAYEAHAGC